MASPCVPMAEDKDVFCSLLSSPAAAEVVRHRGDSGLREKSVKAVFSRFQLCSQHAFYHSEPIMELPVVGPSGGSQPISDWEGF